MLPGGSGLGCDGEAGETAVRVAWLGKFSVRVLRLERDGKKEGGGGDSHGMDGDD